MRSIERFLVVAGALMWCAAFYFGPGAGTWQLGKWGAFAIALSALIRATEFLIPNRKPQPKHRRSPVRKCPVCGKPATSGSQYCSYHARYGPEDDQR